MLMWARMSSMTPPSPAAYLTCLLACGTAFVSKNWWRKESPYVTHCRGSVRVVYHPRAELLLGLDMEL